MSPSGVDSSSVVAKVRTVVAIRTYKLGTSELELYNYLSLLERNLTYNDTF